MLERSTPFGIFDHVPTVGWCSASIVIILCIRKAWLQPVFQGCPELHVHASPQHPLYQQGPALQRRQGAFQESLSPSIVKTRIH